ncbi:MAG: hypothetical protein RL511_502, partial [Bacteroidota bacterium]
MTNAPRGSSAKIAEGCFCKAALCFLLERISKIKLSL